MDALLEALPLPTALLEGDRVVAANVGVTALLSLPIEEIIGRRWSDFIHEEERADAVDRHARRLAGERVPAVYETTLVDAKGRRVPVQIQIALVGASQAVLHLVDLRGESRRRALLDALAGLGAAVQRQLDEREIHLAVRHGLFALGLYSAYLVPAGEGAARVEWIENGTARPLVEIALGSRVVGTVRRLTPTYARFWREGGVFLDDFPHELGRFVGPEATAHFRALPPAGAFDRAIGIRVDVAERDPSASGVLVVSGDWLRPEDVPAFRLFGSQVSAALAAAGAIRALQARNAELAALNRLADAASTSPSFEAFLARGAEVVREAVGCEAVVVRVADATAPDATIVHASGVDPEILELVQRTDATVEARREASGELRAVVRHPEDFTPDLRDAMRRAGIGTCVAVPLRFRSDVVGLLSVDFRGPPRDGAGCRTELLAAMGSHFAAAAESHRLLDDLRRRVGELTLLNDLAVATGALDPVLLLQDALRRVAATVGAELAIAFLSHGGDLVPVAAMGVAPEELATAPHPETSIATVTAARAAPTPAPGEGMHPERIAWIREHLGVESSLGVPLLAKERVLGSLVLGRRRAERFSEAEVRLLSAVGVQLGMAVDNARLFADTQRRVGDLEAVNSLALRVLTSAPDDAANLLRGACREIATALGAEAAAVLQADAGGERLVGVAGWGLPVPAQHLAIDLARTPVAAQALRMQEPTWSPEVRLAGTTPDSDADRSPPLSILFVPLTSRAATRGVVAVAAEPSRRFGPAEVALAYALASEAAMGLENAELYAAERRRVEELSRLNEENARLYEDLRRSYADLARAQEQLISQERLAALGQLAAVVAHEVRNPLGVIFNSLGAIRRIVRPEGDAKMLLDIVGEEADRLNRIVGDLLDFARPSTPRLRPDRLDRVVDDALSAALAGADGRVELVRDVPEDLPRVPMDPRLMRQALLNVLANAVQAMPDGGRLTVTARADGAAVRVDISDTGRGIPEEVRHRIFEPFFTTRPTGTGLGLAVVKRILEDHRATVEVHSAERGGTRFVLRLPLEDDALENGEPPWSRSP